MNTDGAFIARFLAGDRRPVVIDSDPLALRLNARMLDADAKGAATLSFEPSPEFAQGAGLLQGGVVATMLDFAMAFAALAKLPAERTCATAAMTVNFLKPATPGSYLASGVVDRMGSQVAFVSATLRRADTQQVVATASSVMPLIQA